MKDHGESRDFSENNLKNYHGFDWGPCDGGNADMSVAYLGRWSGPVNETDDPYHDWDDRPSPGGPAQKLLSNCLIFSNPTDIKNAVMTYGALYTEMYWDSTAYNTSTTTFCYNGSQTVNHAVTVVGWDDTKNVPGAPGPGAWLIKNSWGVSFGQNGYFYISYYDTQAVQDGYSFSGFVPTSTYATVYEYDPLGLTSSMGTGSSDTAWGANIFTAASNGALTAVAFHTLADNATYQLSVYSTFTGGNFSGLLASTSGTEPYSGYHTVTLPAPVMLSTGMKFAIVVKFLTPNYDYPVPIEMPVSNYSSTATASAGESYVSYTGAGFNDITALNGFANANVCIKGLVQGINVPNDAFAAAITLTGYSGQTTANNLGATREPGEPTIAGNAGGASLWWKWTAPASGPVTFDTHGSAFDTLLGVYTGSNVAALTLVSANDNDGSANSTSGISFTAQQGTTYMIVVDGYNGATGDIILNWNLAVTFTLTTSMIPAGAGMMDISPAGPAYAPDTEVTVTATGNGAFAFGGWSGDAAGAAPSVTIVMNADKHVVANFTQITPPLAITGQPTGGIVQIGSPYTFAVLVSGGAGAVNYQWEKDSVPLPGATSPAYAISAATLHDAGTYLCEVSDNQTVLVSNSARLTVTNQLPASSRCSRAVTALALAMAGAVLLSRAERVPRAICR